MSQLPDDSSTTSAMSMTDAHSQATEITSLSTPSIAPVHDQLAETPALRTTLDGPVHVELISSQAFALRNGVEAEGGSRYVGITTVKMVQSLSQNLFYLFSDHSILKGQFLNSKNISSKSEKAFLASSVIGLGDSVSLIMLQERVGRHYQKIKKFHALENNVTDHDHDAETADAGVMGKSLYVQLLEEKLANFEVEYQKWFDAIKALRVELERLHKNQGRSYVYKDKVTYALIGNPEVDSPSKWVQRKKIRDTKAEAAANGRENDTDEESVPSVGRTRHVTGQIHRKNKRAGEETDEDSYTEDWRHKKQRLSASTSVDSRSLSVATSNASGQRKSAPKVTLNFTGGRLSLVVPEPNTIFEPKPNSISDIRDGEDRKDNIENHPPLDGYKSESKRGTGSQEPSQPKVESGKIQVENHFLYL